MFYDAEGFSFVDEVDALAARKERKQIEYIESKMNYQDSEQVLKAYQKMISDRMFHTPVGMIYLKHLQNYLFKKGEVEKERIQAIPVYDSLQKKVRENPEPARKRVESVPAKKRVAEKVSGKTISIILNIILILAVIFMFWVAANDSHPNIINYKNTITNEYAAWEQELTIREQKVREKEKELLINQ